MPSTVSAIFVMPSPRLERDGRRRRVSSSGGCARLREPGRERHREARRVRGRDQLLGARRSRASVLGASRPADRLLADRAARRRRDRAAAVDEARPATSRLLGDRLPYAEPLSYAVALRQRLQPGCCATWLQPGRTTFGLAIISTRSSARGRSSSSSTSRSARIETSSWSSDGSRVVSRCSHRPGREQRHQHAVVRCACPRSGSARTRARRSAAAAGSARRSASTTRGRPKNAKTKTAMHHHPEQERGAAARMDERVALHDLGLELLPRLVRVDRLVLGGVVLEHAPQVGEQRDQRRGTRRRS